MDAIEELSPFGPFVEPFPIFQRTNYSGPVNTYEEGNLNKRMLLFFSAGTTAACTASLYNGLDCLRVRWQVCYPEPKGTVVDFATNIIKTEGFVNGLWRPGIAANGIAMGLSGALRFGYYEIVRDALHADEGEEKNGVKMALAGLSCGAVAYFVTTPFHLLKTMIQAEKGLIGPNGLYLNGLRMGKAPHVTGLFSGMKKVVAENGFLGLWRGCVPLTARGATFTAGQLVGYDGFKTLCKSSGIEEGPKLHALSGVVAAACATLTATPADYTMSRFMASHETSVAVIVKQIYKEGGITGFWKGSAINFCRSAPVFLTYTAGYEQLRHYFGLGYFG
jgi:hypothetical protein|eukprot:scaffold4285_cov278-Chaetoceros_neogracile.AAC.7